MWLRNPREEENKGTSSIFLTPWPWKIFMRRSSRLGVPRPMRCRFLLSDPKLGLPITGGARGQMFLFVGDSNIGSVLLE
ncbi:hypothetical protein VNO80_24359 [Phaseolus coccineus]|uniref:Uncharacterized protein n=1 Tax=Phaseolus coccineus TaxID=3886 RepID=A0AAN9LSR3_PHACN